MKRMGVLFGQRRVMVLATLTILVLAAVALAASGASFTSTSANPDNVFTAGNLSHTNNVNGAILTASLMRPGDTKTGEVTITNTGDIGGNFWLKQSSVVPGGGDPAFAAYLELTIRDLTTDTQVYPALPAVAGPLNGIPAAGISLGAFAVNAPHTYRFTVHFPDAGVDANGVGQDNEYKGATASCQFDWIDL
jgi:spore coat-associated protein N